MTSSRALLVVDVQIDFCPGGKLPVPHGDTIIPALNRYIELFAGLRLPVFATQDWHPRKTVHFRSFGGDWPEHCVADSRGAQLHPDLRLPAYAILLRKGMEPDRDGYTAFHGRDSGGRLLDELLRAEGVTELFVGGLATDYCVRQSVLDALDRKYRVYLLTDVIKGVELRPGDSRRALEEMARAGARLISIGDIASILSPAV
jgi:nicotinamidase/pyrazinamidase